MGTLMTPYSLIVPVHNGSDRLNKLVEVLDSLADPLPASGELLFADDGSSDGSWDVIRVLASQERRGIFPIRGIRLDGNRGQQSALLAGISGCRGRAIITMDDDLSHPPELIAPLLEALDSGNPETELVYAEPPGRPGAPLRALISRLHQLHMSFITASSPRVRVGSYRGISPALVGRILDAPMSFPYLSAQALTLRPAPRTLMLPSPPWSSGAPGRFSLMSLISLELGLMAHYGPIARRWRMSRLRMAQGKHRADESAGRTASGWIAERCGW